MEWMRIVLKWSSLFYLAHAALPLCDGWAWASVCARLSPFAAKPPSLSLEKAEWLREREWRKREGEGGESRGRVGKEGEEMEKRHTERGVRHTAGSILYIFSAFRKAKSACWSKAVWMRVHMWCDGGVRCSIECLLPSAKNWLTGGARWGLPHTKGEPHPPAADGYMRCSSGR